MRAQISLSIDEAVVAALKEQAKIARTPASRLVETALRRALGVADPIDVRTTPGGARAEESTAA